MTRPRVRLPERASVGDLIEVKTLISHVMETGQRRDTDGKPISRFIINSFTATFAGAEVFKAELHPGISANPYLAFYMRVPGRESSSSPGPTIAVRRSRRSRGSTWSDGLSAAAHPACRPGGLATRR